MHHETINTGKAASTADSTTAISYNGQNDRSESYKGYVTSTTAILNYKV